MTDEAEDVADELRAVRDDVRRRRDQYAPALPPGRTVRLTEPLPAPDAGTVGAAPRPPDTTDVNECWPAEPVRPPGFVGFLFRLLDRVLRPRFDSQRTFNARQVQLDNELLAYLAQRMTLTHQHYDHVLGLYGRHLGEIDERHLILQEELVAHVRDLVKRSDLVLAEAERGRLSLEHEIGELRRRLERLETSPKR